MALVSLRAYARHRGVSLRAVQKAIGSGRIEKSPDGRIDVDAADATWESRTAPRAGTTSNNRGSIPPSHPSGPVQREPLVSPPLEPRPDLSSGGGIEYSRARAIRETYLARLAKIEFEERAGKLVSRDEIQIAAHNKYRVFRDAMLNIPDRVAAILAAETDSAKVHALLVTEIRRALENFANGSND